MAEREGAVMNYGDEALAKAIELLEDAGLPGGLLPLQDVIESGHVKESGYVWITQKKETRHLFRLANKQVAYGPEIRGVLVKNQLKELTGVKAKELFLWTPINDISVDPAKVGKIAFKTFGGLGKVFAVDAFARGQRTASSTPAFNLLRSPWRVRDATFVIAANERKEGLDRCQNDEW